MTALCIIPARGHSKGVIRKNVRLLCGLPLVAHSILAAQAATCCTDIVVTTDDPEIHRIAVQYGAFPVWRPIDLCTDLASSELAILHAIETWREAKGQLPDFIVFMQCTSPLTIAEDIDAAVTICGQKGTDCAFAAIPFHYFVWKHDDSGNAEGINHNHRVRQMRQERTPQYLEAGSVYVMRTKGFLANRHRFFGNIAIYEMPEERRLEIDEEVDFQVAEVLMRHRERVLQGALLPARIDAVVFDFDGCFTNNLVHLNSEGEEFVTCNRSDGLALGQLREAGIKSLVLSSEVNAAVQARCKKLRLDCCHGMPDKLPTLIAWAQEHGVAPESLVYLGNDKNDVACMQWAGCGVAVADAWPEAKRAAKIVLTRPGGQGAVRELCEMLTDHQQEEQQ